MFGILVIFKCGLWLRFRYFRLYLKFVVLFYLYKYVKCGCYDENLDFKINFFL